MIVRRGAIVAAIVLGAALPGSGQRAAPDEALLARLPAATRMAPWQSVDPPATYDRSRLYELIDGGADLYLAYGVQRAVRAEYTDGAAELTCTIFELSDADGAFGLFSRSRGPGKTAVTVGNGGVAGGFQLVFWQDRFFVTLDTFGEAGRERDASRVVAEAIAERLPHDATRAPMLARLPPEGREEGSERLLVARAAADVLFERFGAAGAAAFALGPRDRVVTADYRISGTPVTLTAIAYESGMSAAPAVRAVVAALCATGPCTPVEAMEDVWARGGRAYVAWRDAAGTIFVADTVARDGTQVLRRVAPGRQE